MVAHTPGKPSAPITGVQPEVVDSDGRPVVSEFSGNLLLELAKELGLVGGPDFLTWLIDAGQSLLNGDPGWWQKLIDQWIKPWFGQLDPSSLPPSTSGVCSRDRTG